MMTRTSHRTLRRRLEAAGTRPTAPPRPEFVARLESKLFGFATIGRRTAVVALTVPRPQRRRRPVVPALSAAAAVAAAVVLTGAFAGWFGREIPQHHLALTAAVDTVVVMPDGSFLQGVNGLELPDGALVRTGPSGHVSVGSVDLGPGLEAVVQSGHLVSRTTVPTVASATPLTSVPPFNRPTVGKPKVTRPLSAVSLPVPKVTRPSRPSLPRKR
jgi:hypothetical protein